MEYYSYCMTITETATTKEHTWNSKVKWFVDPDLNISVFLWGVFSK